MYQCWKFEGSFINALDRLACQIITDRGIAMIPLPRWGRTLDWRMDRKKKKRTLHVVHYGLCTPIVLCPLYIAHPASCTLCTLYTMALYSTGQDGFAVGVWVALLHCCLYCDHLYARHLSSFRHLVTELGK